MEGQRGWKISKQGTKCLHLRGNRWAWERGDHQDGLEGAGPWGVTQVPRAVRGQQLSGDAGGGGEERLAAEGSREGDLGS